MGRVDVWKRMTNGGGGHMLPLVHRFPKPRSQFVLNRRGIRRSGGLANQRGHHPVFVVRVGVEVGRNVNVEDSMFVVVPRLVDHQTGLSIRRLGCYKRHGARQAFRRLVFGGEGWKQGNSDMLRHRQHDTVVRSLLIFNHHRGDRDTRNRGAQMDLGGRKTVGELVRNGCDAA